MKHALATPHAHHSPPAATADERGAATYIGVSPSFLRASRMRPPRCDGPPWLKLGRAVRYAIKDLDAYLERRRVDPRSEARG